MAGSLRAPSGHVFRVERARGPVFGTRMIAKADVQRVQEWMGHANIQTTMKYLHYAPREEDAQLVAEAFQLSSLDSFEQLSGSQSSPYMGSPVPWVSHCRFVMIGQPDLPRCR